jgi:hypothetical protein
MPSGLQRFKGRGYKCEDPACRTTGSRTQRACRYGGVPVSEEALLRQGARSKASLRSPAHQKYAVREIGIQGEGRKKEEAPIPHDRTGASEQATYEGALSQEWQEYIGYKKNLSRASNKRILARYISAQNYGGF